jgi:hypothetical protein
MASGFPRNASIHIETFSGSETLARQPGTDLVGECGGASYWMRWPDSLTTVRDAPGI